MTGRYGPDHLGIAMIILSFILSLLYGILNFLPLVFVSYIIFVLVLYRMLSRNIYRRRRENDRFIRYWWPVRTKIGRIFAKVRDRRTYKFIKCPDCKNTLRVPRGKGKIQISCPKCGERFVRKT